MTAALVAGVDGCSAGWVAVVGTAPDRLWMTVFPTMGEALDRHPRCKLWAIDMPVGLATDRPRPSDTEARALLGSRRASSVFPAPPLAALASGIETYGEACQAAEAATGKRISKQAWNLALKIRELRRLLITNPRLRRRVFETHPELTFARLADGEGLATGKKTAAGQNERKRLLGDTIDHATVERFLAQAEASRGLGADDALDAVACWLAARRAAVGEDVCLPTRPPVDPDGLAACIRF